MQKRIKNSPEERRERERERERDISLFCVGKYGLNGREKRKYL